MFRNQMKKKHEWHEQAGGERKYSFKIHIVAVINIFIHWLQKCSTKWSETIYFLRKLIEKYIQITLLRSVITKWCRQQPNCLHGKY